MKKAYNTTMKDNVNTRSPIRGRLAATPGSMLYQPFDFHITIVIKNITDVNIF
jgi:hypothetical protein